MLYRPTLFFSELTFLFLRVYMYLIVCKIDCRIRKYFLVSKMCTLWSFSFLAVGTFRHYNFITCFNFQCVDIGTQYLVFDIPKRTISLLHSVHYCYSFIRNLLKLYKSQQHSITNYKYDHNLNTTQKEIQVDKVHKYRNSFFIYIFIYRMFQITVLRFYLQKK